MKKTVLSIMALAFMLSCTESSKTDYTLNAATEDKEVVSKLAVNDISPEELKKQAAERERIKAEQEQKALENQTEIAFDTEDFNFGDVLPEQPVSHTFKVKNTGDKPLIIEAAKASCGCTVPKKPEEPILPGEEGDLEVTFKSKPGQKGNLTKTVTVTANIPGKTRLLKISANVATMAM